MPLNIHSILFRILFLPCSANFFPFQRWDLAIDAKAESFINFAEYPWAFARPWLISSEMFLFKIRSRYTRKNFISLFQGGFWKFLLQPWNKLNTFRSPHYTEKTWLSHYYSLYHAFSVQNTEAKLIFENKFSRTTLVQLKIEFSFFLNINCKSVVLTLREIYFKDLFFCLYQLLKLPTDNVT